MASAASLHLDFHPAVRTWFGRRFPAGPTEPQARGWPVIADGRDTLIAAPTGSGKTLAAFLVCIDRLYRELAADDRHGVDVVYVSPLKALTVDIQQNLEAPLGEIAEVARELGITPPGVRVLVRSGDTPSAARAAMLRRPPQLLITTPESLYLYVTAERSRETLRRVRTVIVDEIHAVARDKRGSHLALTLERLEALCERRPQRIGLSATQRPLPVIGRLLTGVGPERPPATIVDVGHRRDLDLAVEVPGGELEAVASREQFGEILDRIAADVERHRTTLVFVNTRRQAERVAHLLEERLGPDRVAAHHGSLSRDRRLRVESRLRAGELAALVATASLELGIDVGPVERVCQIGSPRSIATFLQRVGRSGHALGRTPCGRLYPTSRDELVECAALVRAVRRGVLDRITPPERPLDILAQQIVAACAAEPWREDELFDLVRRAAPFAELSRDDFDAAVDLLADGIQTGRGRRAAHLHRDRVGGMLRARRGARIAALTSGGAIPETADYRVVADPDDTFVGTVNEDWAIESMAGDIFLLGSTSWQIRRVEAGTVRVTDAKGLPPTIPFWLGEAPARTAELSQQISELREEAERRLDADPAALRAWLRESCALDAAGADQLAGYLDATRAALGRLPTQRDLVVERFFDETGGMQLVVHAPFGARINRALGLAVRKRICRRFDFELQAAASDDAVVLSLGPQHSFPLEAFRALLGTRGLQPALEQAVLLSPLFTARWRWNLGRALAVLRFRGGKRNPPAIQRMEADDLMAAIWPGLAACQENQTGPIEIPDHPLTAQTLRDCLEEAMDAAGLAGLLTRIERGDVRVHPRETTEPSPACHEILNGRPYTFLDDAPLEERRTRAVVMRRGLPVEARDLARLDPEAIERVREEARAQPRDAEELHDALLGVVLHRPVAAWAEAFRTLVEAGRAAVAEGPDGPLWLATERRPQVDALLPGARIAPDVRLPGAQRAEPEAAAGMALRGHLETRGPSSCEELARAAGLRVILVEQAVAALEAEGFLLRGRFTPGAKAEELCARRLLERIHRYTQERLRREIEPVSARDFLRFLLRWQHVAPGTEREGRRGTLAAIEQLQGFELAAGAWESSVLPARIAGYRSEWLDDLCLAGDVVWARLTPRAPGEEAAPAPSRATPLSLALREDLPWLLAAARGDARPAPPASGVSRELLDLLARRGALFRQALEAGSGLDPGAVERGLWDLVSRGLVSADGFESLRRLLGARTSARASPRSGRSSLRRRRHSGAQGRWAALPQPWPGDDPDELAEGVADQLLARWGVIFRDVLARESLALPWRDILQALRRMEARGQVRGGRFVTGFVGEQYALPGAVEALRRTRRLPLAGERATLSAVDPLNVVGILTPGPRVPAVATRTVTFVDGLPVEGEPVDRAGSGRPHHAIGGAP
jgi:ATP-dependent Lhr-like helicase